MDERTVDDIKDEQRLRKDRTTRAQTGIVTDESPLTISTGEPGDGIVSPYKQKGWTPVIGDHVLVLRLQNTLWVIPMEAS